MIRYNNYEYNYNVNGQRINKYNTSNSVRCYYYYDLDGKLLIEERPAYKLKFLYDSNNSIYGFIIEDSLINVGFEIFYYLIDELGIIYGIMDSESRLLGTYRYNAYGKILEIKQAYYTQDDWNNFIEHANQILNINPIRYKSYYYDVESEMYYLNNRYYYPKLCRFLTPDRIDYIDLYNSKAYNLYSYCYNNPVCYSDPSGNFAIPAFVVGMIVGTCIGIGTAVYRDYKDDKSVNGSIGVNGYAGPIIGGVISGAATGFASSIILGIVGTFVDDVVSTNGNINSVTLLTDMAVSGVFSLVGYGLSKYIMKKFPYSYTRGFNDFVESLGKKTMPDIIAPICEKGLQKFLNDSLESVISSIPGIILELIDKD